MNIDISGGILVSDVPINGDNGLISDYLQNFWLSIPIFIIHLSVI